MKSRNGLSFFLGMICIAVIGALITYFSMQAFGSIEQDKVPVDPTPQTGVENDVLRKIYDGEPIKVDDLKLNPNIDLINGHSVTYSIKNQDTVDVGTYDIAIEPIVKDNTGKDVTSQYNFDLPIIPFIVEKRPIVISLLTSNTGKLSYEDYDVIGEYDFLTGHELYIKIKDEERVPAVLFGGLDLTKNYNIIFQADQDGGQGQGGGQGQQQGGTNDPNNMTLEFEYPSLRKVYDGKPFNVELKLISGSLPSNRRLSYELITSDGKKISEVILPQMTTYTAAINKFKIVETNEQGELDVTNLYNIKFKNNFGELQIEEAKLNIKFPNISTDFTGRPFEVGSIKKADITIKGLVEGDGFDFTLINDVNALINVGTYELVFEAIITNNNKEDVTSAYDINISKSYLSIKPTTYILQFNEKEQTFMYDGTPHLITKDDLVITQGGIALPNSKEMLDKLDIKFNYLYNGDTVTESMLNAGKYSVTVDSVVSFNSNVAFECKQSQSVTVTQRTLTFEFANASKVFNVSYRGDVIDFAEFTNEYIITGVAKGDVIKPKFEYSLKNSVTGQYKIAKFRNASTDEYKINFIGFEFVNALETNYTVSMTTEKFIHAIIKQVVLNFESVTTVVEYDGLEHMVPSPKLLTQLKGKDTFSIINTSTGKDVGTYTTDFAVYEFVDEFGFDVFDNYEILSNTTGNLIIKPKTIKVVTESKSISLSDSNTSFVANNVTIVGVLKEDKEKIEALFNKAENFNNFKGFSVGTYTNAFNKNIDVSAYKNYDFEYVYGIITILP